MSGSEKWRALACAKGVTLLTVRFIPLLGGTAPTPCEGPEPTEAKRELSTASRLRVEPEGTQFLVTATSLGEACGPRDRRLARR